MEPAFATKKKLIEIGPKKKLAFVCSGGATKAGAFHVGVALALQEHGFRFTGGLRSQQQYRMPPGPLDIATYVGSSAGAIISTYLAAGYSLDNIFNSFLGREPEKKGISESTFEHQALPRLTYQKMFRLKSGLDKNPFQPMNTLRQWAVDLMGGNWNALPFVKSLKLNGIFSTFGIEEYLRRDVLSSNDFKDYIADLFIVATALNDTKKVVFGKYNDLLSADQVHCRYENTTSISDACASSIALPVIFSPHPIKNAAGQQIHYIDGEIRDTLSTHVAVDAGADLVIASYTHQPYVSPDANSLAEYGLSAIMIQSIYLLIEQKINHHIETEKSSKAAIQAVFEYCEHHGLPLEHRERMSQILETQLRFKPGVDTIYIHPRPDDAQLFFGEHFTLSPKKMAEIVRSGFRAAAETLKRYRFADQPLDPHPMGE